MTIDGGHLLAIFVGALLVNNFTLSYFLGLCPFFGVSARIETAFRLGMANIFVMSITSLAAGMVLHAGKDKGFGKMVEIDHGNGYVTRYAHVSKVAVRKGQRVDKGQKIAEIGSSGRSTGPHLHLEVLKDGKSINPRKRLNTASRKSHN